MLIFGLIPLGVPLAHVFNTTIKPDVVLVLTSQYTQPPAFSISGLALTKYVALDLVWLKVTSYT